MRRFLPLLTVPLALGFLAGCSDDGPGALEVAAPTPADNRTREVCAALHDALPATVMDDGSRGTTPESGLTAAWGDPAVVLRCGVDLPASMRNIDPDKALSAIPDSVEVNGVMWSFVKLREGGVRFTTAYREANVELTVPERFGQPTAPLVDVADAISRTVPATLDFSALSG